MEKGIWQEIEELYKEFQQLGISQSVDYEKYYLYSLITHSTAIEGSTLTEMDAQLLFDEGVTAKGKPLVYHLMNEDLKKAYELAKKEAERNTVITPAFLQKLNATLMRTTGGRHNTIGKADSGYRPPRKARSPKAVRRCRRYSSDCCPTEGIASSESQWGPGPYQYS